MCSKRIVAVLAGAGIYLSTCATTASALTLPPSGVDTRAIAAGHYHGYDDGFGSVPTVYSGTQTSRAGSDSRYGGIHPGDGMPFIYTGSYSASASLYDGKLRAMAAGSSITRGPSTVQSFSRASASLKDAVFFTVPVGYQSPVGFPGAIPVTAMIHLTGSSVGLGPHYQNNLLLRLIYDAFGFQNGVHANGLVEFRKNDDFAHSNPSFNGFTNFGNDNYGWRILVPNEGARALNFSLQLTVTGNGGIIDYSNTAAFSFVLPDGVGFTSQSGVLLTGAPAATVPEPSSWALMIIGFGVAGGMARTRRKAPLSLC